MTSRGKIVKVQQLRIGSGMAILLAGTASLAASEMAYSQAVSGPKSSVEPVIEEVMVTARRRTESLQDIPVAVTHLSADLIENMRIQELSDLNRMAPNVRFTESSGSGGAPALFIRGQGSVSAALSQEPSVGVYIDGVFSPRSQGNVFSLPDVEQIEVLRGPQGTLFGRNTTGGAVVITTVAPREEAGGSINLSYGKHNDSTIDLVVHSGNVGDTGLKMKLAYQDRNRDGWVKQPSVEESDWAGNLEERYAAFDILYDHGDAFSIRNTVTYSKREDDIPWQFVLAPPEFTDFISQSTNPPPVISPNAEDLMFRDPREPTGQTFELITNTLTFQYEVNPALRFKSITGYRRQDQVGLNSYGSFVRVPVIDRDGTGEITEQPFNPFLSRSPAEQEQITQEFQISGVAGEVDYIAGLFYWQEDVDETLDQVFGLFVDTPSGPAGWNLEVLRNYAFDKQSVAAFGQLQYRPAAFDEKLELSGGLRYTEDEVTLVRRSDRRSNGFFQSDPKQTENFDNVGFSASASYQWTPDLMTYFTTSSAFRGGSFNSTAVGTPAFDEETVLNYEFGTKSTWFDNKVQLNLAAFYMDYDDMQLLAFEQGRGSFVQNAGKATISGFEVEFMARINEHVQIDGNYGYVNPEMDEFISGGENVADQGQFPLVPDNTYRIGLQFTSNPTPLGVFTFRTDYSFADKTHSVVRDDGRFGGDFENGEDKNLSVRLNLTDIPIVEGDARFKLQIYGNNLTDNRYEAYSVGAIADRGLPSSFNRPRNYGVSLSVEY